MVVRMCPVVGGIGAAVLRRWFVLISGGIVVVAVLGREIINIIIFIGDVLILILKSDHDKLLGYEMAFVRHIISIKS